MPKRQRSPAPEAVAKVLIVDDDERNAFAAREALEVLGHDLVIARSGEEALRQLLVHEFAVILLDLHMPGMDGYETARLIREHPRTRDTPIVFVTAVFRDEAHIFQAYSAGAVDVVFKPADPFILRSKVSILVDLHLKTVEVRRQAEESQRLLEENARVSAEKLAAEQALRAAGDRQEAILKSLPVVFTSRVGAPPYAATFVSESIAPLTGFAPERFVNEPDFGLGRVHPDDVGGVAECLAHGVRAGVYACEYRWLCADGAYRIFLDQGVSTTGLDGNPEILGTLLDVTERRSLEEQLGQARKMEAVGQLTGGVAHDFNNLLTVILGNTDILLRRHREDERLARQLSAIRTAADRGQTLTRQLLAFSRRQVLNPRVVDLNALIEGFAPLMRQAVGAGVTLSLDLRDDALFSEIDPTHLETALLNLVVNARDAMGHDGEIVIATRKEGAGEGTIRVRDSGCGMSPDVAARIFEPFFTTKDVGVGTGLGLSQVYGFVQQSGGRVTVDTRLGDGATITLALPLTDERPAPIEAPSLAQDPGRRSGSVLVVEDDPAVLTLCVDLLTGLGYRCATAAGAEEALGHLEGPGDYDVLFSDVVMPGGVNGIELARRALGMRPGLKVLLTSGYLGDGGRQEAHDFPVIDKPYEEADLAARLHAVMTAPAPERQATA